MREPWGILLLSAILAAPAAPAVAIGAIAVGQGDTSEAAINDALDQCGDGCRVVVSDCE